MQKKRALRDVRGRVAGRTVWGVCGLSRVDAGRCYNRGKPKEAAAAIQAAYALASLGAHARAACLTDVRRAPGAAVRPQEATGVVRSMLPTKDSE